MACALYWEHWWVGRK